MVSVVFSPAVENSQRSFPSRTSIRSAPSLLTVASHEVPVRVRAATDDVRARVSGSRSSAAESLRET